MFLRRRSGCRRKFRLDFGMTILSNYKQSDEVHFAKLLSDPEVMLHVDGIKSVEQIARLFKRAMGEDPENQDNIWAIRRASDGQYLGHAALYNSDICSDHEREILFYVLKEFWGQGHGMRAGKLMLEFARRTPAIANVLATVDQDHTASIRVCEKIGMRELRKGIDEDGEFIVFGYKA